jgi:NAD+ kinase
VVAVTRVGVVGAGADAAGDVVSDAGGDAVVGGAALESDVDCVAVLGEAALLDIVEADLDVPVLPVDAGSEYGGVEREQLPDALGALAGEAYDVRKRPTLGVRTDDVDARALADAVFVTTEPAQISEYAIETDDGDVDEVRADGVVAATPAGSHGYASDAGGPLLDRGSGVVSVVPIAPFRAERVQWVLDPPAAVTVLREESEVGIYVDGRERGTAGTDEPVTLTWSEPLRVAAVADSEWPPQFD